MNKPLYEIEVKAFYCTLELWVNDILIFNHTEENGSIWVDWPVNRYILNSGMQHYELRLFPYKNQLVLAQNVEAEIGIHAIDAIDDSRVEVLDRTILEINPENNLPFFSHKGLFEAHVPYKMQGWQNSEDLSEEEEENLLSELIQWNSKLLKIYTTSDSTAYANVYKDRESDFDTAHYISTDEQSSYNFHSKFKELLSIPVEAYKLEIYGNGKLASLKLPSELPGFTFQPKKKEEDNMAISLLVLFHRKQKGMPLEIIR